MAKPNMVINRAMNIGFILKTKQFNQLMLNNNEIQMKWQNGFQRAHATSVTNTIGFSYYY